jgi:CheY-like chemotaxis protein
MEATDLIKKIAIIEDDPISQFIINKTIKSTIYTENISVFSNGMAALDYFNLNLTTAENLPDVILLDINMPVMNGWQFINQFSKLSTSIDKKIYIYLLTSSQNPDDLLQSKNLELVTDYLIKPLDKEKLIKAFGRDRGFSYI